MRRDESIYHQVSIDVPRTCPELALFKNDRVRQALTRVLYCWSIRRPASGYVQGINDLATPLLHVFLSQYLTADGGWLFSPQQLEAAEADAFWCLSKLLDSIQDNYTFNQAGIYRQISRLREIITRTDSTCLWQALTW